jgi:Protein of unknown function DUF262
MKRLCCPRSSGILFGRRTRCSGSSIRSCAAIQIGIALLWETSQDLQYRKFEEAFHAGQIHDFKENRRKKKLKLVLDGQQRLQSLHIALYGSYEGKSLYFDVLSGRESDDLAEEKYDFEFLDKEGFDHWQKAIQAGSVTPQTSENGAPKYLVKIADLFAAGVKERDTLVKRIKQQLALAEDDEERLTVNIARFDEVLTKSQNILKLSVIDEDLPGDNPDRKSEADVLEIFVRVNREGTPLSRSDLIFSMLKLNWRESAESLPEFVRQINEGNASAWIRISSSAVCLPCPSWAPSSNSTSCARRRMWTISARTSKPAVTRSDR